MKQSNKFKKRVFYQIYPASFKDSNNDGWGDLNGIRSELPYLKSLGIGIIWLSPIYASPMEDMGYDISDYKAINPLFGTMDDFDNLIKEANKLDIKIVMDLVINHTSTEHKWFKEAIKSKDNPYRDYYIIREGKGKHKNKYPNNWQSAFTGTAWEKIEGSNDFYLHLYAKNQADLNYKNPKVVKEVESILKFWLDKGVYGFRCDVINQIYKTSLKNDYTKFLKFRGSKYYLNQDGMFKVLNKIRTDVLDNYDTFLVGETSEFTVKEANRFLNERCLDMFFEFDHVYADKSKFIPLLKRKFSVKRLIKPIFKWQNKISWIALYLENHDQLRSISRYGSERRYPFESGSLLATLLLTLKGSPFIYEGEEIGMLNYKNCKISECKDVASLMATKQVQKLLHINEKLAWKMVNETINRDHARSPMQWKDDINAGFNNGAETWISVNPNYPIINVEKEDKDPHSLLNFYRKLIHFRNEDDVLRFGDIHQEIISKELTTYYRTYKNKTYLIVLNFGDKKKKYSNILNLKCLISNYSDTINFDAIPPYFAGIYEVI